MNVLMTLLELAPVVAGCAAVAVVAMTKVRDRSERAALFMAGGAGAVVLSMALRFVSSDLVWALRPLVFVGAVGSVVYGLFLLLDTLHPKHGRPMPALLSTPAGQSYKPNVLLRGFFGFFGVVAILSGMGGLGPSVFTVTSLLALAAVLAGSYWVDKQGPFQKWVLERRPEWVLWAYVHQLTVVNRKTGSRSVHWSAQCALSSGTTVGLPAQGEAGARALVGAVLELRPGILVGHSPENATKYQALLKSGSTAA